MSHLVTIKYLSRRSKLTPRHIPPRLTSLLSVRGSSSSGGGGGGSSGSSGDTRPSRGFRHVMTHWDGTRILVGAGAGAGADGAGGSRRGGAVGGGGGFRLGAGSGSGSGA